MDRVVRLSMIAAVASNRVIGIENDLPWSLRDDLRHFMRTTKGHPVIMGRRTYESMGKPLPDRTNIVLTRQSDWCPEDAHVEVVASVEDAIVAASKHLPKDCTAYVIGGGVVYEAFLPRADELIITHVDAAPEGHAHFPVIDQSAWRKVRSHQQHADDRNEHSFHICWYERAQ